MKTAVVFDTLTERGGGERATLVLARAFDADVYTTTYDSQGVYPEYQNFNVFSDPLLSLKLRCQGSVTRSVQGGLFQTECLYKFRKTDLSGYDLVITLGQAKHIPVYPGAKRVHYELWVKNSYRFGNLVKPWVLYMDKVEREAIGRIKTLACNSENIRRQMLDFYHRDAEVIYPAVNINMFHTGKTEDYFLAVERLATEKNIEAQLEAFRMAPQQKLLIAGAPNNSHMPYLKKLRRMAPPNVTFLGRVSDSELIDLYSHARATIQTNLNEDLGRIPIEAMASGKPCIAFNAGGFRETIVHGQTGILIDPPYVENLADAIRHFNNADFKQENCLARAQLFSEEAHIARMKSLVARISA